MNGMRRIAFAAAVLTGALLFAPRARGQSNVVDCVVAVVNNQVISLYDVKVVEAFGLFDAPAVPDELGRRRFLLDRLIDQKVAIDLARGNAPVDEKKVDDERNRLLSSLGRDEAQRRLAEFGLDEDGLRPYCRERVLSDTIVADRFARSVAVSLQEIEDYYVKTYALAVAKRGELAKDMLEVLPEIEAEIKKAKIEAEVALWIKNLRQQAEIEIRPDCLGK
jgi:hypothetical protein